MTPTELQAIGMAVFGMEWQSALARAIDMSPRHMRRLTAGVSPITETIAADIRRVLGVAEIGDPDWPRDEWIVGDAPVEAGTGARREYIVHTRRPRFVARVVAVDNDGLAEPQEDPADILTCAYSSSDYVVCEIVWIDPPPGAEKIHALLEAACDAIDENGD